VKQYPGIPFIAAHMGGLTAPFEDICGYLPPSPNLFLDTSNAAHTLSKQEFIHLLKTHGPRHVIFGTDWPWFDPAAEMALISGYLEEAGFSMKDKEAVFGGNIARLLGPPGEGGLYAAQPLGEGSLYAAQTGGVGSHSFPGEGAKKREDEKLRRWEDGKKHEEKTKKSM
jgi:hypothetical protein